MTPIITSRPMPEKHAGRKGKKPFSELEPGQSFIFSSEASRYMQRLASASANYYQRKLGRKFATRMEPDGIVVYRIS